jgi:hypothetical protein
MLRRVKFIQSCYDGSRTYNPGDIAEINTNFAKRCVLVGAADHVDENGEVVAISNCYKHLKITLDDIINRGSDLVLKRLRIEAPVKRMRQMLKDGDMEEYEGLYKDVMEEM